MNLIGKPDRQQLRTGSTIYQNVRGRRQLMYKQENEQRASVERKKYEEVFEQLKKHQEEQIVKKQIIEEILISEYKSAMSQLYFCKMMIDQQKDIVVKNRSEVETEIKEIENSKTSSIL